MGGGGVREGGSKGSERPSARTTEQGHSRDQPSKSVALARRRSRECKRVVGHALRRATVQGFNPGRSPSGVQGLGLRRGVKRVVRTSGPEEHLLVMAIRPATRTAAGPSRMLG